jgi:hypothetical protein
MELTLDVLKTAYPDLFKQIDMDAFARGLADGKTQGVDAGMKAGAEKERERIKAVEAQALPGHEDLIASLKFDGITSGPEAAVKVLAAEKALVSVKAQVFQTEHTKVVAAAEPSDDDKRKAEQRRDASQPLTKEGMKAAWDKDAALRAEFAGDYAAYEAYTEAAANGQVRIYGAKGGN